MSALGWICVSYAGFVLATFGLIGMITYRDEYDTAAWFARIAISLLWPVFWLVALCSFFADMGLIDMGKRETKDQDGRHD